MWAGIAGCPTESGSSFEIALSIHDSVYNTDFASETIPGDLSQPEKLASDIEKHVIQTLRGFSTEHICKFVGAGVASALLKVVSNALRQPTRSRTDGNAHSAQIFAPGYG